MIYVCGRYIGGFNCFDENLNMFNLSFYQLLNSDIGFCKDLGDYLLIDVIQPEWLVNSDNKLIELSNKSRNNSLKNYINTGEVSSYFEYKNGVGLYKDIGSNFISSAYPLKYYINKCTGEVVSCTPMMVNTTNGRTVYWRVGLKQSRFITNVNCALDSNCSGNCGITRYMGKWWYTDYTSFGYLSVEYRKLLELGVSEL